MSSPYDESLLATAPKATKAQLQDGYNPELLVEKKTSSTPPSSTLDPAVANLRSTGTQQEQAGLPLNEKKSLPFYRTTKGIIIIVVAVIIIIAVIVGGAVGGTRKKKSAAVTGTGQSFSSLISSSTSNSSSTTAPATAQGVGSDSPSSVATTPTPTSAFITLPPPGLTALAGGAGP